MSPIHDAISTKNQGLMSSGNSHQVRTPLGIVLPARIAAIIEDSERHPEKGRLIDRINPLPRRIENPAVATSKKRRVRNNKGLISSMQLECSSCALGNSLTLEGSICICDCDNVTVMHCSVYLVSILPDNPRLAVTVVTIPGRGSVPCLCEVPLIHVSAIDAFKSSKDAKVDKRKSRHALSIRNIQIASIPACRGDLKCHLLTDGPKYIKGRLVDTCMLDCLKAGCLRTGDHSKHAYYTLNRKYSVEGNQRLNGTAQLLIGSPNGMRLCPAGRMDVKIMIRWAHWIVEDKLKHHPTMNGAIISLNKASNLPQPTMGERMLQISIGGDPDSLMLGKFVSCAGLCSKPDVSIRCACGFGVIGTPTPHIRELLIKTCEN